MWSALEQITNKIKNQHCLYLRGPLGSGKTFLVRNFASLLLKGSKEQKIFMLYRAGASESVEALLASEGEVQGWQDCADTLYVLGLSGGQNILPAYCQDASGWRFTLQPLLQREKYDLIIILDDYEKYRQDISKDGFQHLNSLKNAKTCFVLVNTEPRTKLNVIGDEETFLWGFEEIDISLPTLEEAAQIVQDCWKKNFGEPVWKLKREHALWISQAAGRYPLLLDTLTSCFVDIMIRTKTPYDLKDNSNLKKKVEANLEYASKDGKFLQNLRLLWESLEDGEREILQVFAIAQIVKRKPDELFEIWFNRMPGDSKQKRKEAKGIQNKLEKERLLLIAQNRSYQIASPAFADVILEKPKTKELAYMLDFKLPKQFSLSTFLKFLFSGALFYLISVLIQYITDWPIVKEIGILFWTAPFIYYFWIKMANKSLNSKH